MLWSWQGVEAAARGLLVGKMYGPGGCVGLEEVTGQGWVVDDETGPQGSVEGREDQWYEVEVLPQQEGAYK